MESSGSLLATSGSDSVTFLATSMADISPERRTSAGRLVDRRASHPRRRRQTPRPQALQPEPPASQSPPRGCGGAGRQPLGAALVPRVLDLGGFQFCDLGIRGNSSRAAGSQGSDERSAPPPCAFRERERGDHGGLTPEWMAIAPADTGIRGF